MTLPIKWVHFCELRSSIPEYHSKHQGQYHTVITIADLERCLQERAGHCTIVAKMLEELDLSRQREKW